MLVHNYNGGDLSNVVPLEGETGYLFAQNAELGAPETTSLMAHDPGKTLEFTGLKTWYVTETAIASGAAGQVWRGYVGRKTVTRKVGNQLFPQGRGIAVELHEINFLLSRVNFHPQDTGLVSGGTTTASANRPAETVSTRMTWLLANAPFAGVMIDHGLIQSSSVSLDANDYRNRTCDDVLKDLALATNYNYLLRYRAASADIELIFHDFNSSGLDVAADFAISNDPADSPGSAGVWVPFEEETAQTIDPARVADAVTVAYGSGRYVKVSDAATTAAFAPQHQMAPGGPFKSLATATVQANRLLAQHDEEEDTVECVVRLPRENLNDVLIGQLITAKFTHFDGWEDFRACRVMRKAWGRPGNLTQSFFYVQLKLVPVETPCEGTDDLNLGATVTAHREIALVSDGIWNDQGATTFVSNPGNINDGNNGTNTDRSAHIEGGAPEDRYYRVTWRSNLGAAYPVTSHLVKFDPNTQVLADEMWYLPVGGDPTDATDWVQIADASDFINTPGTSDFTVTHAETTAQYWALRKTQRVNAGVFGDVGRILIATWAILGCPE